MAFTLLSHALQSLEHVDPLHAHGLVTAVATPVVPPDLNSVSTNRSVLTTVHIKNAATTKAASNAHFIVLHKDRLSSEEPVLLSQIEEEEAWVGVSSRGYALALHCLLQTSPVLQQHPMH